MRGKDWRIIICNWVRVRTVLSADCLKTFPPAAENTIVNPLSLQATEPVFITSRRKQHSAPPTYVHRISFYIPFHFSAEFFTHRVFFKHAGNVSSSPDLTSINSSRIAPSALTQNDEDTGRCISQSSCRYLITLFNILFYYIYILQVLTRLLVYEKCMPSSPISVNLTQPSPPASLRSSAAGSGISTINMQLDNTGTVGYLVG